MLSIFRAGRATFHSVEHLAVHKHEINVGTRGTLKRAAVCGIARDVNTFNWVAGLDQAGDRRGHLLARPAVRRRKSSNSMSWRPHAEHAMSAAQKRAMVHAINRTIRSLLGIAVAWDAESFGAGPA